ncbi:MAG: adenylate/guanylate cyclase domain-containing protein, partial [Actinomycetota bacterium]
PYTREERFFTEADLEVLDRLVELLRMGLTDMDTIVAMTRVVGQGLARIADAEASAMKQRLTEMLEASEVGPEGAEAAAVGLAPELFPALESFLTHVWRRHLAVALERVHIFEGADSDQRSAVGFADVVGFTRLSRHIGERELLRIIELLDAKTQDLVSSFGGRIVKMIGDEVMFTTPDPADAAEIALHLTEDFGADETLPDVRVGLAFGPVLSHRGDCFGPTVNLANRAAGTARPGTVLVSEDIREALTALEGYELKAIRRRHLKGIGPTRLWTFRRRS